MERLDPVKGIFIKGKDDKDIFLYCWNKVSNPRAVVQVFHDIGEHAGRYKGFAEFLNDNGIIVYANDHRGHGKTAADEQSLDELKEMLLIKF